MFVKSFVKPVYPTDWGKFSKWCCSDYCTMYLSVKKVSLDLLLMPSRFLSSPPDRGKLLIAQQAVFFFCLNIFVSQKKESRPFTHALYILIITLRQRKITHTPTGSENLFPWKSVSSQAEKGMKLCWDSWTCIMLSQ